MRSDVQGNLCYFRIKKVANNIMVIISVWIPWWIWKLRDLSRDSFVLGWNINNNNLSMHSKILKKIQHTKKPHYYILERCLFLIFPKLREICTLQVGCLFLSFLWHLLVIMCTVSSEINPDKNCPMIISAVTHLDFLLKVNYQ